MSVEPALRADAQKNRELILTAAEELLLEKERVFRWRKLPRAQVSAAAQWDRTDLALGR